MKKKNSAQGDGLSFFTCSPTLCWGNFFEGNLGNPCTPGKTQIVHYQTRPVTQNQIKIKIDEKHKCDTTRTTQQRRIYIFVGVFYICRELFESWCTEKKNGCIVAGYCVEVLGRHHL